MLKTLLDTLMGVTRILIREDERALHLDRGQIRAVLTAGEHRLPSRDGRLTIERHTLARPEFASAYEKALFDRLPQVAAAHLTVVETGPGEVAVVLRDGRLHTVLAPEKRQAWWTEAGPWTAQVIDTRASLRVEPELARRITQAGHAKILIAQTVVEGQLCLLYIDGELVETLKPGVHTFWNVGRQVHAKVIDMRMQSLDVAGQEVLTKDRVTIRVNLAAEYRVVDPVKAATATKDFADAFYRALQYAFRKALGAMSLDQILADKATVDAEARAKVTADMAEIGIEVLDITLKDVILPGEMREILNKVVAAEKEAEANVIRRREETNATRSLLNTAKVMADNPVMLRLKELEALETIAAKVESITVHNGTDGLINDLVRLRDR